MAGNLTRAKTGIVINTDQFDGSLDNTVDTIQKALDRIDDLSTAATDLTDMNISAPIDGQVLSYDNASGKWINATPASGITDHTLLTNIGSNTHTQIDTHIADSTKHYDMANINITESQISDLQAYILASGVTFENLNANGDVGTITGTVAAGDHTHVGVYEPIDATILRSPEIGVNIQGYDPNTTIAGNTFNAPDKLVQLDSLGKLPAVDGSQLTGITIPTTVGDLTDTAVAAVADGQILQYDLAAGIWRNADLPEGGGSSSEDIDGGSASSIYLSTQLVDGGGA